MGDKAKNSKVDIPTDDDPGEYFSCRLPCPPPRCPPVPARRRQRIPRSSCAPGNNPASHTPPPVAIKLTLSPLTCSNFLHISTPDAWPSPLAFRLHPSEILARCCDLRSDLALPHRAQRTAALGLDCHYCTIATAFTRALPSQLCTPHTLLDHHFPTLSTSPCRP